MTKGMLLVSLNRRLQRSVRTSLWLATIAFALLLTTVSAAQPDRAPSNAEAVVHPAEIGLPFIQNFDPAEFGAASTNFEIAQDRQGVIYVGNNQAGVLVFDGTTWRRIAIPNLSGVRALAADETGRIYVGAVGELGYLAPDGSGQMQYVSLLNRIPPEDRGFADVWRIFPTRDGVFFGTFARILRLRGNRFTVWNAATAFHATFWARGTLFVREVDRGLLQMVGDRLVPVVGGERFATERIYALLPWGAPAARSVDLLIGTRTQGWFVFDGNGYRSWITEADAALKRDQIFGAIWLADGTLAVATLQGGVYLLDVHGRLLSHLTKAGGLIDDVVYALFEDRQRGLWLGLNNGIARIDMGSPLTRYDERTGLQGSVNALQRHAGRLYACTMQGLFRLDSDAEGSGRFVRIPQVPGSCWDLLEFGRSLLVGTNTGVFEIGDDHIRLVRSSTLTSASLLRSQQDPARVFVGQGDGIASMRLEKDRWVDEGRISGVADGGRTMFEEADGRLWLGTDQGGIHRLTFPRGWTGSHGTGASVRVEDFGSYQGLPSGGNEVYPIDAMPRFTSRSGGLFQFDASAGRFVPDPRFATLFPIGPREVMPVQDARGRLWMAINDRSSDFRETGAAVPGAEGIFRWVPTPLQPLSGIEINTIHGDRDGVVWFGGTKGLFRYDPAMSVTNDAQFTALVRTVTARDGRPVVGGMDSRAIPTIAYGNNALRFEFAAPSYDTLEANRFQIILEGLDRNWSAWSSATYRDYTSLPEGDYRFRVRGRNVYGVVSAEASYAFRILPPWYRTAWAYLGFATVLAAALWLAALWGYRVRAKLFTARMAVLTERHRIARELHDTVAQNLGMVTVRLDLMEKLIPCEAAGLKDQFDQTRAMIERSAEELRSSVADMSVDLRPRRLLHEVLRAHIDEQIEGSGIDLAFACSGHPRSFGPLMLHHVCRIAREAVSNAMAHSGTRVLRVCVDYRADEFCVAVEDRGSGLRGDVEEAQLRGSGLRGMQERADLIEARLTIAAAVGGGMRVQLVCGYDAVADG